MMPSKICCNAWASYWLFVPLRTIVLTFCVYALLSRWPQSLAASRNDCSAAFVCPVPKNVGSNCLPFAGCRSRASHLLPKFGGNIPGLRLRVRPRSVSPNFDGTSDLADNAAEPLRTNLTMSGYARAPPAAAAGGGRPRHKNSTRTLLRGLLSVGVVTRILGRTASANLSALAAEVARPPRPISFFDSQSRQVLWSLILCLGPPARCSLAEHARPARCVAPSFLLFFVFWRRSASPPISLCWGSVPSFRGFLLRPFLSFLRLLSAALPYLSVSPLPPLTSPS